MCQLHEAAKDRTVWRPIKLGLWTGRAQSTNVPVERGGPTAYARRNIDDPVNAFMSLMDQRGVLRSEIRGLARYVESKARISRTTKVALF